MSQLEVATLVANSLFANSVVAPGITINSTALGLGSNTRIGTAGLSVGNSTVNNVLQATVSEPNITINGSTLTSIPTAGEICNVQIFTANGTWTKPSWATTGYELVFVHMWGAGGGGNNSGATAFGGGGGAFVFGIYMGSQVNSTANVVVGLGGGGGQVGGSSTFANATNGLLTAYGGGGAGSIVYAGGGAGWLQAGSTTGDGRAGAGGAPLGGNATVSDSTFGGGNTSGGNSIYGGGGGNGGRSIFGGGGGAYTSTGVCGTSIYGGNGGNNSVSATTPGGGGGNGPSTLVGARGEVRVYTLRKLA